MKKTVFKSMAILAIALTSSVFTVNAQTKAEDHKTGQAGQGPHGGTIQEADPYHAEILNKDGMVMLYLLDGKAAKMSSAGVTGKAIFMMADGKTITEVLKAKGDDGFEITNKAIAGYSSCIASFTVKGKTVTAKFKGSSDSKEMYQCPMKCEGEKTYDKAGKCPKCGMDMKKMKMEEKKHEHKEGDHHH
jgi:hypothetical protein